MNREEWCKTWIDTNYNPQLSRDANVGRGVLAWQREFPTENLTATLMDIRHLLNTALDNHLNYSSSGRQRNKRGEVDIHFGKAHSPYAALEQVKRLYSRTGER